MIVKCHKRIHANCSSASIDDIHLQKMLDLSFIPLIGMGLLDGEWEMTVVELWWDNAARELNVYDVENKELYEADLYGRTPRRCILEIAADYFILGWELDERSRAAYNRADFAAGGKA